VAEEIVNWKTEQNKDNERNQKDLVLNTAWECFISYLTVFYQTDHNNIATPIKAKTTPTVAKRTILRRIIAI
jgi:hypothetical protein